MKNLSILTALSALLSISCTRETSSNIKFKIPELEIRSSVSKAVNAQSTRACYAVNIRTVDPSGSAGDSNSCDLDYQFFSSKTVEAGEYLSITVPSNQELFLELFAYFENEGVDCPRFPYGIERFSKLENTYLVGSKNINIQEPVEIIQITAETIGNNVVSEYGLRNCASTDSQQVIVENIYTTPHWSSFVAWTDTSLSKFEQTDTLCTSETGFLNSCFPAGFLKKVVLSGYNSCDNLNVRDSLGAFKWICDDSSGDAIFYTEKFNEGHGLSSVIEDDGSGFKFQNIEVFDSGSIIASSNLEQWWAYPLTPVPDASAMTQSLSTAGIYYLSTSGFSTIQGLSIESDNVSIVTLGTSKLELAGSPPVNCDTSTGEPGASTQCYIFSGGQKFLWIEGSFDLYSGSGAYSQSGLFFKDGSYLVINNSKVFDISNGFSPKIEIISNPHTYIFNTNTEGTGSHGVSLSNLSNYSILENIVSHSHTQKGLTIDNSNHIHLKNISTHNNGDSGLSVSASSDIKLVNIRSSNNEEDGVLFHNSNNVTGIAFVSASNVGAAASEAGINVFQTNNSIFSHMSSLNSMDNGFRIENSEHTILNQGLGINNSAGVGMRENNSTNNSKISQFAVSANGHNMFLYSSGVNSLIFTDNILVGSYATGQCYANIAGGPIFTGVTCDADGASSHTSTAGGTFENDFIGIISSGDSNNLSDDAAGKGSHGIIDDWNNFENNMRFWGKDETSAFPDSTTRGPCRGACEILDYSLLASGTEILNTSENGSSQNATFFADSPCPASVDGNKFQQDSVESLWYPGIVGVEHGTDAYGNNDNICEPGEFCYNISLQNATEILDDQVGDDDGLCESNESCVYSPNFGAYQGHNGITSSTCTFSNGAVSNVKMYSYQSNGRRL
ncbi:MAG: right-handed parallel beta-helix repeat-containing protein [Bdellovibrionales bacterium]